MIEPKDCTYEEFPEAMDIPQGVKILDTVRDEWFLVYKANVKYVERNEIELHLQILQPEYADHKSAKFPCVIYIQGSAWMKQDTYATLPNLAKLAHRGFVIVSVEYRHSSAAPFPAQLIDCKTAIRFIRKNSSLYNVDPDNIFVFGDSSGGHTSLMLGITQNSKELDSPDFNEYSVHVNAVVDFYGPTDISRMNDFPSTIDHVAPSSPEGLLIGGKNVLENMQLSKKTCPIT